MRTDSNQLKCHKTIEILKAQLLKNDIVPDAITDIPDPLPDHVAILSKSLLVEAKLQALEKSQVEWKTEKSRMQKAIGTLKSEIEGYKLQLEEKKNSVPAPAPIATLATTTNTSGWFKSYTASVAASTTSVPAPATTSQLTEAVSQTGSSNDQAFNSQLPLGRTSITNLSASNMSTTSSLTTAPIPTVVTAVPAAQPAAPPVATKSWWGNSKAAAPASSPLSFPNIGNPADSEAKIKYLEQELEATKKQLKDAQVVAKSFPPPLPEKSSADLEKLQSQLSAQIELNRVEKENLIEMEKKWNTAKSEVDVTANQLEELQKSLNASLVSVLHSEEKIKSLEKEIVSLQQENTCFKKDIAKKDLQIEALSKQYQEASSNLKDVEENSLGKILEGQSQIRSLGKEIETQTIIMAQQTELRQTHVTEIGFLQSQILLKNEEIFTIQGDLKLLQTRVETMKTSEGGEGISLSGALDAMQEEFKKQLSIYKQEHGDLLSKNQLDLNNLKSSLDHKEKEKQSLISIKESLEGQLVAERTTAHHLTQEKSNLEVQLKDVNYQLSCLQEVQKNLESQIQSKDDEKTSLSKDYEHKLEALDQAISALVEEKKNLDRMIQNEKDSKVQKVHELNSVIEELKNLQNANSSSGNEEKAKFEAELQGKASQLEILQCQIKTLIESRQTSDAEHQKKCQELFNDIEKKSADIVALTKKSDSLKAEADKLQKNLIQNKETSDQLSKSLQEQITQLIDAKSNSEKKLKVELEEKSKKEKADLEASFRKEKTDIEEKGKNKMVDIEIRYTKEKVQSEETFKKEKAKLGQDIEKFKKDYDTLKAESTRSEGAKKEELSRVQNRIKQLEGEYVSNKAENQKLIESLNSKITDLSKELSTAKEDQEKLKRVSDEFASLMAKHEVVMQENEVAQANYERNLKGVTEKEDALKKMKALKDEIASSERTLKSSVVRLEREREILNAEISSLKTKMDSLMSLINSTKQDTDCELQLTASRMKEMEAELTGLQAEKEELGKKLEDSENELSANSRKSAQLVRGMCLGKRLKISKSN
jgi:chromosome segregation ATPase